MCIRIQYLIFYQATHVPSTVISCVSFKFVDCRCYVADVNTLLAMLLLRLDAGAWAARPGCVVACRML